MEDFEGGFLASSQRHEHTGVRTLRNLTAKQIGGIPVEDGSSALLVDRFEVSNVQVCGHVSSLRKTSTGYVFELDDTTGTVDCAFWINGPYDEAAAEQIMESSLLKVTGSIKVFAGKKTLGVSSICLVTANCLVHHLVSCLYQHLFFNNKLERTEEKRTGPALLSRIQEDILEVYRNNQDSDGLDIEVAVAMLRDKYSDGEVRGNIESLLNNCHLYSVDGTSYKTTI